MNKACFITDLNKATGQFKSRRQAFDGAGNLCEDMKGIEGENAHTNVSFWELLLQKLSN